MTPELVLNELLSGKLIGNIVKDRFNCELQIKRHTPKLNSTKQDRFNLIHKTKAYKGNIEIGNAKTYIKGNLNEWEKFKDIRMNILLGKFGYKTLDCKVNLSDNTLNRTIISSMEFGVVKIQEQIFLMNLK